MRDLDPSFVAWASAAGFILSLPTDQPVLAAVSGALFVAAVTGIGNKRGRIKVLTPNDPDYHRKSTTKPKEGNR